MKKIVSLLVLVSLFITSCSDLQDYELPYDLSPTTGVSLSTNVTAANAVCPAPTATLTVDSESTVYYVVQPAAADALISDDVFDDGKEVDFAAAGSEEVNLTGLDLGGSYTIYAVTVNVNGIRSEAVTTTSFTMPSFSEVVDPTFGEDYTGTVYYGTTPFEQFDVTLSNDGSYAFSAGSLWGDAIAGLTGNAAYAGMFQYPGVITLDDDFSLTVTSESGYALGGAGEYDSCTGTFTYELSTDLFDDPDTEEVETLEVTVELAPAD